MVNVLGIKRECDEKLLLSGSNRIWFCDGCQHAFLWDEESNWYGSIKDMESRDYHRIWFACSVECRDKKPIGFPKGIPNPNRVLIVKA